MKSGKPSKAYADFPLTANGNGQWSKRINGRTHYFGVWADPQAALESYKAQRDYLYAGQTPPNGSMAVNTVLTAFKDSKSHAVELGELSPRSLNEYEAVCDLMAKTLGESRAIETLESNVLVRLRVALSKGKNGTPRGL